MKYEYEVKVENFIDKSVEVHRFDTLFKALLYYYNFKTNLNITDKYMISLREVEVNGNEI